MIVVGVDLRMRQQSIAVPNVATGELINAQPNAQLAGCSDPCLSQSFLD
jgi:hypothetical protein